MIDLKVFRKENNIPQSLICDLLDVKQPYISAIENGKRPLSKEKFDILYKHFGDIILKYRLPDIVIKTNGSDTNPNSENSITNSSPEGYKLRIDELETENRSLLIEINDLKNKIIKLQDTILNLLEQAKQKNGNSYSEAS